MKIEVRYYTKGGNTEKLATAVASAAGVGALPVSEGLTGHADILFLGSSLYAGKPAAGNLWYGSGTHINMWNVFEAEKSLLPVADVLDVQFGSGGTAADVSPMSNAVVRNGTVSTTYNDRFGRYVAQFSNAYGGSTSSFYKVDYAASRTDGAGASPFVFGMTVALLSALLYSFLCLSTLLIVYSSSRSSGPKLSGSISSSVHSL